MSRGSGRASKPSALRSPSGEPGPSFATRLQHHGARVLLLVSLALLIAALFPPVVRMTIAPYELGMVAPEDVIAQVAFEIPKTPEELERDRGLAMSSVPPTLLYVRQAADTMAARLDAFFSQVVAAASSGDRAAVERILRTTSIIATPSQVDALLDPSTRAVMEEAALTAVTRILPQGVVDAGQAGDLTTPSVTVVEDDVERSVPTESVITQQDFFEAALGSLPSSIPPDISNLLRLILIRHIEFSYTLDVVATEMDRDAAARSVPATKGRVLAGQAIVRAADAIGLEEVERLSAYQQHLLSQGMLGSQGVRPGPFLGAWLVNVLLLAVFGLVLLFYRRPIYDNYRWVLLIALLTAAYFGVAAAIARNGLASEWLPIAFVALPVAVLWDTRTSLVLVLVTAAITGTLPSFADYGTVITVIAGGAAAAMSIRAVRRRSETWLSISIITAAAGLALLGHGLAMSHDMGSVARAIVYSGGNATVSALLAMGFLFVFELFTGITTDQTLLEWADPTRPLLKRLSLEAPGTYAHTINVANLAESAAHAIGANGLLCRVGVYYHDVGKMLRPHYYVENQLDGRNPHDKLKSETSASIVREHVTDGIRLAREAKVPESVVRFIPEHHGTQRIGFFYDKAREEVGEGITDERFSYPGPKPQSRETAIAMLADSSESATLAMRDPTPERVKDLIHTIVQSKIEAGQLDEAPLTLGEIAKIEAQFVSILSGVFHRRLDYPATKHLTESPGGSEEPASEPAAVRGEGDPE